MSTSASAPGFVLQDSPLVYVLKIPGPWLLKHSTPSWRLHDPDKGFQRVVKDKRAREIAISVLDQHRTFPNAIVLATTAATFQHEGTGDFTLPGNAKFLVVDGQHRLYAQKHSKFEAPYVCIVHMRLDEIAMARLFLEINDNQRRVPSSLRWDLVRLVRPGATKQEEIEVKVADIVYLLTTTEESPFFATIDRTGDLPEFSVKQGSLAPEIYTVLTRDSKRKNADVEDYADLFIQFFSAVRSLDPDGWGNPDSAFYKTRVLRALLRVLSDLLQEKARALQEYTPQWFAKRLGKIDSATLSREAVHSAQGAAGVKHIYDVIRRQVFTGAGAQ